MAKGLHQGVGHERIDTLSTKDFLCDQRIFQQGVTFPFSEYVFEEVFEFAATFFGRG